MKSKSKTQKKKSKTRKSARREILQSKQETKRGERAAEFDSIDEDLGKEEEAELLEEESAD